MRLRMKRSLQYSLFVFSVLYGLVYSQELSTDEHSSGTIISSLFTPEMLLLSPELQGTFARNYFWPGLFKDSITETGIQFGGPQMKNLSAQGSARIGRCFSGLQIDGFDHNINNTQSARLEDNDSVEIEGKNNNFSIGGKFYCVPFLFLENGISAECSYERHSNNRRSTEWDSTNHSATYKINEFEQMFFIHARGIHRLSWRHFLYADWWMDLNGTIYKPVYVGIDNPIQNTFSRKMGFMAGFSSVRQRNYNWHISAGTESYMRRTENYYNIKDNPFETRLLAAPFQTWVVDAAFMKEVNLGDLTQYSGAKLRLSSILTKQEMVEYRDPGFEFTVPLLLKYCPVPKITFYTGSNVSLTCRYHKEGSYPGNVIRTYYDLSPIAVQWTPTIHHFITVVPQISDGVMSGSFEWRYRF
jgi:hypothetical protein